MPRMMRAVRLRLRTSLLVVARAKTLKAGSCLIKPNVRLLLLEKPSIPRVIRIIGTPEFLFFHLNSGLQKRCVHLSSRNLREWTFLAPDGFIYFPLSLLRVPPSWEVRAYMQVYPQYNSRDIYACGVLTTFLENLNQYSRHERGGRQR